MEGQNIARDTRYAEGKVEALPDLAAELVRLKKVDIIVTQGTPAAEALIVLPSPFLTYHAKPLVELAAGNRLPGIYQVQEFVDAGGLMSCGLNFRDHFRRAAAYVDKILKGAKPADLPVERPM